MLDSERFCLVDKLKKLEQERDRAYTSALRAVTRIINQSEFLSTDHKTRLLDEIWSK